MKRLRSSTPWLATCCLVVAVPTASRAQELASSFDQLRVLVKAGDRLTITDATGQELRGQLTRLSGSSLELSVPDDVRAFQEGDVRTIRLRRADSLANGAKWGFGVGCALGALGAVALAGELDSRAVVPFVVAMYGAMGAGVGVGIDALIKSNDIVFSRAPTAAALSVTPVVSPHDRGVRLVFRF